MKKKPTSQVPQQTVDVWLKKATISFGIRSIISLLDKQQLRFYAELNADLISYYRKNGFQVEHIPVRNYRHPALSDRQLHKVWKAYKRLEKASADPLQRRSRTHRESGFAYQAAVEAGQVQLAASQEAIRTTWLPNFYERDLVTRIIFYCHGTTLIRVRGGVRP